MSQKKIVFTKMNFIICGVAIALIIIGFALMGGPASSVESGFEPDIFSARRVKVAPAIALFGFLLMIVGILYPIKNKKNEEK